ncbi:hypothetical protein [Paenibacillus albus]|uniref:Uncharacterized protein n=1 Tax=Paenibacillus albus TaxID=2495582 RepID=A0A3S9A774_9BACL|nr:hypothetical protein [Paenibacillus albus]AZN41639.1 hypothetical protein EJC50_19635 [Paenibacillus albus]
MEELILPHKAGFNFGVGVKHLSGSSANLVVVPEPSSNVFAAGPASQYFTLSRITSTEELEKQLGIDVNASYGCASFGAGISARFSFAESTKVSSSSIFMSITATVKLADLSIDHCKLTPEAGELVDKPDIFANHYGDMFCRACKRGGVFVAVIQIVTNSLDKSQKIEAEMNGSYGFFSADAAMKLSSSIKENEASAYCQLYTEGGPSIHFKDPTDPSELLQLTNDWFAALINEPEKHSVPYEWLLSPISIADGPLPLNAEEIRKSQDIIRFCARERLAKLDILNTLSWILDHNYNYDFTVPGTATLEEILKSEQDLQNDLECISDCAIDAAQSPRDAVYPQPYAQQRGKSYPAALIPQKLPTLKPGATKQEAHDDGTWKPLDIRNLKDVVILKGAVNRRPFDGKLIINPHK